MNIVKGVADLIRRSSPGQPGEGGSWAHGDKLSAPSPRIRFGDVGEEAVLNTLWQRYENAIDKIEKRKLLQVFLLHFIQTYKNWEPVHSGTLPVERASGSDVVAGCSSGHPSEVILILVQEIARITSLVTKLNNSAGQVNAYNSDSPPSLSFSTEELYVLNCLTIITRSMYNCLVFSYYGGVQKVTALLKAAVVQLKTLTSALVDEQLTNSTVEKTRVLQKILVFVVSIISNFMELYSSVHKSKSVYTIGHTISTDRLPEVSQSSLKGPFSEEKGQWRKKAIVLVMEAGGVNWLVELLRVIRRLNLKDQGTDLSLHYLALGALRSALSENPRAQNHFRSIGGLEVLLDGLGLPSSKFSVSKNSFFSGDERFGNNIFGIFQLQILSLEVLREATFGNLNNMQFLCENGRIQKLANSICWPAFMLQELHSQTTSVSVSDYQMVSLNSTKNRSEMILSSASSVLNPTDSSNSTEWNEYSIKLSRALCSFLLAPEDIRFRHGQASVGQSFIPVSLAYWELSVRWVMKVLLTVFPCIKACSNESVLPSHIRILANTLQHFILCTFRKVLVSTPSLLEVFREVGVWDLIFSEKFFYFGPSSEDLTTEIGIHSGLVQVNTVLSTSSESSNDQSKLTDVDVLQVEAISFLEFAATLNGNTNNMPECSVLLDALEQSACNPKISSILLKSLLRVLQLAIEQTLASFKSLDAVARVLKVACIQAQEARKVNSIHPHAGDIGNEKGIELEDTQVICSVDTVKNWIECMESSWALFNEYVSIEENAKSLVLHNPSCIDCLFDLFWEENLQKLALEHILGLLKLPPSSTEDRRAKLQLCSKYLETFTHAREKDKCFAELCIDLLVSMREIILIDRTYYQALFRDGECFLHIVSLLNGTVDEEIGEKLVLNVLQTLTLLLTGNDDSKVAFRALVGVGYQTLQSLLLDFCKWQPSEGLLNALLDMLVDGKYVMKDSSIIKNEDVIILFFNVCQKSSILLQHHGLDVFLNFLKDSFINRTSCCRTGMLSFLLDWFSMEETDNLISKIAKLIQMVGGHSISGKDIRKIFALLRSDKFGSKQKFSSLLLTSVRCMLKEKGPEAFFELNGSDSGIVIKSPFQWPYNKGFSFSCWVRVENFPEIGMMGLFCFLTDNGRGCLAMLGKDKLIFEASDGRTLFNVSPMLDNSSDKNLFEAVVMEGTKLCSRRLLQEIIYCVGGVSVFFPLLTLFDQCKTENGQYDQTLIRSIMGDKLAAEVVELIASVLDGNIPNQQQMHLLSGFSILGFLFQSVPPQQLNMETLSALKFMFDVLKNSGMSEVLMKDAIVRIYLNPQIWVNANYEVQRDLYLFLIQHFENDGRMLPAICGLPRIIDIICQFYWDKTDYQPALGNKLVNDSVTGQVVVARPGLEQVRKIRLLLLSLAEMSLRQKISPPDIRSLIAFFEKSQDMVCIEDVLHMVIRAISQKPLLGSFLEQVNLLGGCHVFINLLQREWEPIRLLGLQFLGKLLVGLPPEKKGTKFFSISVGRSKSISEIQRKGGNTRIQPIYFAISERLFKFPLSDHLCATLFDVLLGGASPKQVLQKRSQSDCQKNKKNSSAVSSHFFLPQILICIFNFLSSSKDSSARAKVLGDILDLLDSNPSNIEALMESAWNNWLETSVRLDVIKNYEIESKDKMDSSKINELSLVRNLYCVVLSHYVYSVKGGWHQLEETTNFLLLNFEQGQLPHSSLLRDIFEDLIGSLLEISSDDNIFILQPCRDNTLYLLKLIDELLSSESDDKPLFHGIRISSDVSSDCLQLESQRDVISAVMEIFNLDVDDQVPRIPWSCNSIPAGEGVNEDDWWKLYDKAWSLICEMNGKGSSKMIPRNSILAVPSFGQRARGLVESLNIPAAEMAAVVVSGGISNALGGKTNKSVDKAMMLRGEKCQRIIFHLVILYLCKAGLEGASSCVQQFVSLLPSLLTSDDEQSKNRLHFFIWTLLMVRSQYGVLDDGARFHVISHLILETVNFAKSMLASSIMGREDTFEVSNNSKESGFILNLIQRDRILAAASDAARHMKATKADRIKQLQELRVKVDAYSAEKSQWKAFEDEIQSSMNAVLSSDDSRKVAFQLSFDEDQQIVADKWIHMLRALIDERGPWSANPFPNNIMTRWKLDKTEDSWRRRQKLKRNYKFNEQMCHPPSTKSCNEIIQSVGGCDTATGTKSPEQIKRFLLKGVRGIAEEKSAELCEDVNDLIVINDTGPSSSLENQDPNSVKDCAVHADIVQDRKDSSSSTDSDLSEVHLSMPCVLVTPKRKLAGHLSVMQNVLHFSGEFLVEGTGGSSVFSNFCDISSPDTTKCDQVGGIQKNKLYKGPISLDQNRGKGNAVNCTDVDALIPNLSSKIKRHRRWIIAKIKAVHWTRYLLQYTAIEIFFNDSIAPIFLNFASPKDAKHVGTLVISLRNEFLFPKGSSRDRNGIISFIDQRVAVEMAETIRESWRRREISNFEYLMALNTLAGRSYNDLTQYPVFPWVIADYSSEKLDFNKSSTFRDLTKPVGGLDQKRFEVFDDRYRNFCDPDIPSFYYGSHYSSMGSVLYYLLRLEPFTALHRNLQGGKFDHADRLFQSIEGTFRNCLSNTSDVKELIPEFFYMPEFLVNSNSYHLGVKQDGEPLGDVALPPWAKGSPEEFIHRNREALESEYVSSNLHHWIDLVFGYKQRGKPAVEAANVFYYLTYEGAVDLETMDDILQRSAIEDQIANFGQTPIQIFRKKHPRRGPPIPIAHPLYFAPASITLTSIISSAAYPSSSVLFIGLLDSYIVIVNQGLILSVKLWLTTQLQSGGNFTFSGSQEPFFGIGSDVLPPRKIGTPLAENFDFGRQCLAILQSLNENYLISCGNWENSFQVMSLSDGRIVQTIRQHKDLVSCIAVSSDGSILATGSYDTTVMVWHVYRGRSVEKRSRNVQTEFLRKDCVVIESPFHILCGHDDIITCLFVSVELDIVISGSKDGTCIFHTLREGRYVRSIQHPSGSPLSKLVASQHGRLVLYAENDLSLHMYSVNGKHIASSESNGRLSCIELSSSGDFLVCAGDHGQIVLRSMHSLDVVRRYEGVGKTITSLAVTPEECFLAGTKDGSLLLYSIENPQLRRGSLPRNVKSKPPGTG